MMKLTPLDIRKQEFKKTLRGYDPIEVQTFLEMVGEEYEQSLEKNKLLNNRLIELETKLKDYQESEKNLRETLLNVQEVKKQSEASSRKQADLVIKESELKALEIIEMARKQARQMRDEVSILRSQKESFINRLRQILISQIELLSVLEIDDAVPEEALKFLENVRSRKKLALSEEEKLKEKSDKNAVSAEKEGQDPDSEQAENTRKAPDKTVNVKSDKSTQKGEDEKTSRSSRSSSASKDTGEEAMDISKKVDNEINEFFKKEIQIDELMKDLQKKNKKDG